MKIAKTPLAAAVAFALAGSAFALPVTVVYQGTVDAGSGSIDYNDLFGGGDLGGDAITTTYVYDTSLGFETTDGATVDEIDGGLAFSDGVSPIVYASPILSATFEIAGFSYSFTPDYSADAITYSLAGTDTPYVQETVESTAGDSALTFLNTLDAPASLTTSFFSYSPSDGSYLDTAFVGPDNTFDAIVYATDSVSVSAAPEPSTWALMLAGVGLAGLTLRRKQPRIA